MKKFPAVLLRPAGLRARIVGLWMVAGLICCTVNGNAAETNNSLERPLGYQANIPVFRLTVETRIASDTKAPCTIQLLCPKDVGSCTEATMAGVVRFHGASSQSYPKKSFGLTLTNPMPLLGMGTGTHWVLNAAFIDRSLMRHKLSYDLFLSLSSPGAPRFAAASRFGEVYLNGKYQGAYLVMQRVDRALLQLHHFSSNETRHASIYKAIDHAANFSQAGHGGYEQREPDPLIGQFWEPLDNLNRFISTSSDVAFFDPLKGITTWLDLDNAIDFHLLVLVTSNGDGITKNFILARDIGTRKGPEPKFFFVPWDYDATFGRNWNATVVPPDAWLSNHLFERLYGHVEYQKKYQARWRELRKKQFSLQTIQGAIDDNAKTLGEAIHRNNRQWRSAAGHYPDKLTFEEDVTAMKQWVAQRLEWLDKKFGL